MPASQKKKQQDIFEKRRSILIQRLSERHKIDYCVITHAVDIRYLCGATEGVSLLLVGPDIAVAFTSKMFENHIPQHAPGTDVKVCKNGLAEVSSHLGKKRYRRGLGYQGDTLSHSRFEKMEAAMARRKLHNIGDAVTRLRMIKDSGELSIIRRCVKIAEQAFLDLKGQGRSYLMSKTERQLAAELEYRMCMLGADRQAFPDNGIIAAAGPNSASCHHFPGERRARKGEPLLFDWGAELKGYRCDITRVVFMGEPSPLMRRIYDVVYHANAAGIAAVKADARCIDVSNAGWDVVREAGYADEIRHGLGHGFGLEIHEPPGIGAGGSQAASATDATLSPNMTVTVEPGIYIHKKGGVRLEDDVVVTAKGHRRLTTLPTAIDTMILH